MTVSYGQFFQVVIWGLAAIGAGLFALTIPGPGRALLWGLWFFICLAFGMPLLELRLYSLRSRYIVRCGIIVKQQQSS